MYMAEKPGVSSITISLTLIAYSYSKESILDVLDESIVWQSLAVMACVAGKYCRNVYSWLGMDDMFKFPTWTLLANNQQLPIYFSAGLMSIIVLLTSCPCCLVVIVKHS